MTASYPSSVKSFTTKVDGTTTIEASHINDLQDEVVAVQTALAVSPFTIDDTVTAGASPASVANLLDMYANILKQITGESTWYANPDTSIGSASTFVNFTYQNSWVDYGSGYNPGSYCKDKFGLVHLRGLIKNGTVGAYAVATLPTGFRPPYHQYFAQNSNGAMCSIAVLSTGAIQVAAGNNVWVSLDGLTFQATQ
jgi:hypothetical protein